MFKLPNPVTPAAVKGISSTLPDKVLIKNGVIVNHDGIMEKDVLTKGGFIEQIENDIDPTPDMLVIDAEGYYIFPGGIDTHTHMQFPFMSTVSADDFFTGTKAAVAGGTTTIMDFVIDPSVSLLEAYETWRKRADEKVCCDYCLHVCPTKWNEEVEKDMEILVKEHGVNSFKMFMTYDNLQISNKDLLKVFEKCRELGAIAMVHAEVGDVIKFNQNKLLSLGHFGPESHLHSRPEEVETAAALTAIVLANQVSCPLYIVHVMSKTTADVIAKKRYEGCVVFGEVVAAALGVDGSHYFNESYKHAAAYVMSPPLRDDSSTPEHLMNMLAGGALQTTGSDHCTFCTEQKALGLKDFTKIPNGVNGVEERMSIVWEKGFMTGKITLCDFVALTSTNAAKIFNIYPRKGHITVGADADMVIWDPNFYRVISVKKHHQAVDFNIFEGMKIHGGPKYVFSKGRLVTIEEKVVARAGTGNFVPTPPFSPVYHRMRFDPFTLTKFVHRTKEDLKEGERKALGLHYQSDPLHFGFGKRRSQTVIPPLDLHGMLSKGQGDLKSLTESVLK